MGEKIKGKDGDDTVKEQKWWHEEKEKKSYCSPVYPVPIIQREKNQPNNQATISLASHSLTLYANCIPHASGTSQLLQYSSIHRLSLLGTSGPKTGFWVLRPGPGSSTRVGPRDHRNPIGWWLLPDARSPEVGTVNLSRKRKSGCFDLFFLLFVVDALIDWCIWGSSGVQWFMVSCFEGCN